jgi:hypothetical protein
LKLIIIPDTAGRVDSRAIWCLAKSKVFGTASEMNACVRTIARGSVRSTASIPVIRPFDTDRGGALVTNADAADVSVSVYSHLKRAVH